MMPFFSAGTLMRRLGVRFAVGLEACYLVEILLVLGYLAVGLIAVPLSVVMLAARLLRHVLRRPSRASSET